MRTRYDVPFRERLYRLHSEESDEWGVGIAWADRLSQDATGAAAWRECDDGAAMLWYLRELHFRGLFPRDLLTRAAAKAARVALPVLKGRASAAAVRALLDALATGRDAGRLVAECNRALTRERVSVGTSGNYARVYAVSAALEANDDVVLSARSVLFAVGDAAPDGRELVARRRAAAKTAEAVRAAVPWRSIASVGA